MASGYSNGSGGAITEWDAFDAWACSVEGARAEQAIGEGLRAADAAAHPFALGWAPIDALLALGAHLEALVPEAWRRRIARAPGQARAVLRGSHTAEALRAARTELERPLRELLGLVRTARAGFGASSIARAA